MNNTEDISKYRITSKSWTEIHTPRRGGLIRTTYKHAKTWEDWDWPDEGELIGIYSLFPTYKPLYLVGRVISRTLREEEEPEKVNTNATQSRGIKKKKKKRVSTDISSRIMYQIEVLCTTVDMEQTYACGSIIKKGSCPFVRVEKIS